MSWQQIDHIHKHLVTLDDLNAGSGFAISYPLRVENCAMHVLREIEGNKPIAIIPKKIANTKPARKTKRDSTHLEYDSLFG